jgi:4-hydroxybenzoate polyprenyltransferase
MSHGLSLLFGLVGLLAAVAMAVTAYLVATKETADTLQLLSGVAFGVAILAGGLAIVAVHVFE